MDHSQTKPGEHHENQVQPSDRSRKGENHENKPQPSDRSRKGEPNQPKPQKEKSFDEGESQEAHHEEEDSPQPKVQPKDKAHDKSPQKPVEQKHVEQKPGEQKPSEPKLAEKGSDKTFLTMGKVVEEVLPYTLHDLLFPAGKVAKLCKITDAASPSLRFGQACSRFGFEKPSPVVILSGAMESNRSKFYAGICRAAFRTDATIIDSGVKSGIEQFTLRRRVKLVGVFPESEILLPKVSPTDKQWNELSNGHTHLFMLCEHPSRSYRWNDEAEIKMKIAKQIAEGTSKVKMPKCKIVTVVMGDLENCTNDIIQSINNNLPVLIVGGSQLSNDIIKVLKGDKSPVKLPFTLLEAFKLKTAHIYCLEDNNSEEIASFLHFFLTVTPF